MSAQTADPTAAGERIELLLEASAAAGPVARERAEELVRTVVELYGAGLERVMELAYDAGALSDDLLAALAGDDLVAGLLLVHGLHPYGVEDRIERALDDVRPYLGSHGGDVKLLAVTEEGVVRLQLLGSCDGCASSAVTLELAVEDAIHAAAPEIVGIEVEEAAKSGSSHGTVIPVEQLTSRVRAAEPAGGVTWAAAATVEELAVGRLHRVTVEGLDVLLCRLTSGVYAYRDACPGCGASFEGAGLQRSPALPGSAVLTCRQCSAHFDVRRAGTDLEQPDRHLEPLPLLERDGIVEIAVRAPVPA
ncbi:MAG: NifU family protein [Actinomycetota bacterium]|nr:NifU family protein [Actinomycetota bacterium]